MMYCIGPSQRTSSYTAVLILAAAATFTTAVLFAFAIISIDATSLALEEISNSLPAAHDLLGPAHGRVTDPT